MQNCQRPLPAILFIFALGYYLYAVSFGWHNTLTDLFGFRQTQTAISTYYMVGQPFKLAYDTPVLGPPWSIPMEFPLFQWTAATLVELFGYPLDQTGRFLSVAFYLLTLIPAYFLLGTFLIVPPHRLLALSFLLASPYYIFWSRTFLIETAAIFFCVAYLACSLRAIEHGKTWMFALAGAFGILGGLVKITTSIPFCFAVAAFAFRDFIKLPIAIPKFSNLKYPIVCAALLGGLPIAAGVGWAKYADSIKEQNVLGHYITSKELTDWNFGTWQQRLSPETWKAILQRVPTVFSTDILFFAGCITIAVASIFCHSRWKLSIMCIALFLLSPAVFTNLQFVHSYYMNANGIFLIGALAFFIVGMLESQSWKALGLILAAAILIAGVRGHRVNYLWIQKFNTDGFPRLAEAVRDSTPPEAVNVFVGYDWDSAIPYYSQRRALMIPDWGQLNESDIRRAIANLRDYPIGVVVYSPRSHWPLAFIENILKENGLTYLRIIVTD